MHYLAIVAFLLLAEQPTRAAVPILYEREYNCPAAHLEIKNFADKLASIKSRLQQIGCENDPITGQFTAVVETLTSRREEFFAIIDDPDKQILSAQDSEKVRQYSQDITESAQKIINSANGLFRGSWTDFFIGPDCQLDEKKRSEIIQQAAGLVYEVTDSLKDKAGPYSVPLQIGGSVLSGVISGIATFIESSDPFQFSDRAKSHFYAETLCLHHQFDIEARQLLNPQSHLHKLEEVEQFLDEKIAAINSQCTDCEELTQEFIAEENPPLRIEADQLSRLQITESSQQLGEELAGALTDRAWMEAEIARIRKEINKYKSIHEHPTLGLEPGDAQSDRIRLIEHLENASAAFVEYQVEREIPARRGQFLEKMRAFVRKFPIAAGVWHDQCMELFYQNGYPTSPSVSPEFLTLRCHSDNHQYVLDKSLLYYRMVQGLYDYWQAWEKKFYAYQEYCRFFEQSIIVNSSLEKFCDINQAPNAKKTAREIAHVALSLDRLIYGDTDFPSDHFTNHDLAVDHYRDLIEFFADNGELNFAFLPKILAEYRSENGDHEQLIAQQTASARQKLRQERRQVTAPSPVASHESFQRSRSSASSPAAMEESLTVEPKLGSWQEQLDALLEIERERLGLP